MICSVSKYKKWLKVRQTLSLLLGVGSGNETIDLPAHAQHLLWKIERGPGDTASSANSSILTLQCPIAPSLACQPYEGGIIAERDGQVPRLCPRGGGSVNERLRIRVLHIAGKGSFMRAIAIFIRERAARL